MARGKWVILVAVACVLMAGVVAAVLLNAVLSRLPITEVVRAQQFELLDSQGRVRGEMSMGKDGRTPSLVLHDAQGSPRAALNLGDDGCPALAFFDEGSARASLTYASDHGALLAFKDGQGQIRVSVALWNDHSDIVLWSGKGELLWNAP